MSKRSIWIGFIAVLQPWLFAQEDVVKALREGSGNNTLIRQVWLVDLDHDQPQAKDVLIRFGRIYAVGDAANWELPENTRTMDGTGKYLMPSLSDMHYHMPGPQSDARIIQAHLFFFLAHGITQVRIPYGQPNHPGVRALVASGQWPGPRLWLASAPISDRPGKQDSAEAIREAIYQAKADGFDLVKTYGISDPERYQAAVKATRELDMPFFGHVSATLDMALVFKAGQDVEHFSGYGTVLKEDWNKLNGLIEATKTHGMFNGPTSFWYHQVYETDPEVYQNYRGAARMPEHWRKAWDKERAAKKQARLEKKDANQATLAQHERIFRHFHRGGLPLLISGAVPEPHLIPGFSIIQTLETYTQYGMTPREAFRTGTHNASAYLGLESEWGHLREGQWADALLLEKNPLDDVDHLNALAAVIVKGAVLPAEMLERGITYHLDRLEKINP